MVLLGVSGVGVTRLKAQAATATILGTVTDASGAAVPDAAVQVKNTGTGATQSTTSDAQGRFRLPELVVGNYDIQATKMGFSTVVHNGITLNVGSQTVVDFSLPIGQQTQTVTVEGQVSQVETTNATVGTLTDQRQMRELPLNGRNFEQLILLAPGVNQVTSFSPSGFQGRAAQYSIAGSRPVGQAILLDDESLQNFWNKGMGSVTGSSLGVEAIAEFQTLTGTYGAQFGGNGGVINSVSKSGTNSFHGTLYEYLRNDKLDAYETLGKHVANPIKPELRQNQFGGALGGPIKKDKLFFFGNYEGIKRTLGVVKSPLVPDCTAANAFTGGLCTPSASLSATTRQSIIDVLRLFPAPDVRNGGIGVSTQLANQAATEHYGLGRADYNLSDKDSIFFRSVTDKTEFVDPFGGGGFAGAGGGIPLWPEGDAQTAQFSTVEWRRIVNPTLVNVARIHFTRNTTVASTINSVPALQLFFPGAGRQDGQVTFSGGLAGLGGATQLPFNEGQNRFTEGDDIIWTRGAHSLKFGTSVSRLQTNTFMPFRVGSIWQFAGLSGFLAGQPLTLSWTPEVIPADLPGAGPAYANRDYRHVELTPYIQDDWKVSSKLTVNLGVRYSFMTNPVEQHGQLYTITDFNTATNFTHVDHTMRSNPTTWNFDPRIGIAFDPFADHKTSIRAGFGMFHDVILPSSYTPSYWNQPPWTTFQAGLSVKAPAAPFFPAIPSTVGQRLLVQSAPGFDYNSVVTTPYQMQYSLNIQRELTKGTVLTVGYIGSRGVHMLTQVEQNPLRLGANGRTVDTSGANGGFNSASNAVVTFGRLNPNLGTFPDFVPTTTSRYHSLQVNLTRRFANNFATQVSYTWGKCRDNGSFLGSFNNNVNAAWGNPYNQDYDLSVCNYDITHQLRLNGSWDLPFNGNLLVRGWRLSGIVAATTGLPYTVLQGVDSLGWTLGVVNPRPNLVDPSLGGSTGNPDLYFNPRAFAMAPVGTFGNSGRLSLRGPNFNNTDISITKDTKIKENLNLQFRAEFFNLFNHPNYGLPIPTNGTATLYTGFTTAPTANGLPTIAIPNSAARLAVNPNAGKILYMASNPRQIQFALKLTF
jgi:hypothetical protein